MPASSASTWETPRSKAPPALSEYRIASVEAGGNQTADAGSFRRYPGRKLQIFGRPPATTEETHRLLGEEFGSTSPSTVAQLRPVQQGREQGVVAGLQNQNTG